MPSTRTALRQRLAQDLRAYKPDEGGTATGGTISTLVQATYPIQKNVEESSEFDGWFLLRPAAGSPGDRVRKINQGMYDPKTGTITVDRPYTSAPATDAYELHGHGFEPWNGVDLLLNAALQDIHVVATIPFAPRVATTGNYTQNLTDGDGSGTVNTRIMALTVPRWVHRIDLLPLANRQIQTLTIANGSTTTWHVIYRGVASGVLNTTDAASVVQTALRLVPGMEAVTVVQTGSTPNFINTVTMTGAPLQSPLMATAIDSGSGTVTAAISTQQGMSVPQAGEVSVDNGHVLFDARRFYEVGDVLYIRCELRAYDWCRASATGAWGAQVGVSAEAHQVIPPPEWVSAQAQVYAWQRFPDIMQDGMETRHVANQAQAQALADRYKAEFLRSLEFSPLLTYPAEGGETTSPSPLAAIARDVAPATPGR